MKSVKLEPAVELALRSLDPDDLRRVQAWFSHLARWDIDEVVRRNSVPLDGHPGVFVMRTTTEVRIFFRVDGDVITVLDVANAKAILASAGVTLSPPPRRPAVQ